MMICLSYLMIIPVIGLDATDKVTNNKELGGCLIKNLICECGHNCKPGKQGPTGPTGPTGAAGIGPTGPTGPAGIASQNILSAYSEEQQTITGNDIILFDTTLAMKGTNIVRNGDNMTFTVQPGTYEIGWTVTWQISNPTPVFPQLAITLFKDVNTIPTAIPPFGGFGNVFLTLLGFAEATTFGSASFQTVVTFTSTTDIQLRTQLFGTLAASQIVQNPTISFVQVAP